MFYLLKIYMLVAVAVLLPVLIFSLLILFVAQGKSAAVSLVRQVSATARFTIGLSRYCLNNTSTKAASPKIAE